MPTQAETKTAIQEALANNQQYLETAILAIFARQTMSEQSTQSTQVRNNIGFNGSDARILSSFAEWIQRSNRRPGYRLTERQAALATRKMKKYWRQLAEICLPFSLMVQTGAFDAFRAEQEQARQTEQVILDVARQADRTVAAYVEAQPTQALEPVSRPSAPAVPNTAQFQADGLGLWVSAQFSRKGTKLCVEASQVSVVPGYQPEYFAVRTANARYNFEFAGTDVTRDGDVAGWRYTALSGDVTWDLTVINS